MGNKNQDEQKKRVDSKRRAYQKIFTSPHGKEVLRDLAVFCGASKSSFDPSPYVVYHREGRREVWLRIQQYLNVTDHDIWRIFDQEKD